MAVAAKVGGFDTFCDNIELDNYEEMKTSAGEIAKKLNKVYYSLDADSSSHLYIVGSVGRKTAIKGSSDLDIIFDTKCLHLVTQSSLFKTCFLWIFDIIFLWTVMFDRMDLGIGF